MKNTKQSPFYPTKREYFAAHAPDVPDWFEATYPPEPKQPTNHWTNWLDDNPHKQLVKDWHHQDFFTDHDLPEELKWYQDLWEKFWKEKTKYKSEKTQIRYFQWRAYYADTMIAELEKQELTQEPVNKPNPNAFRRSVSFGAPLTPA